MKEFRIGSITKWRYVLVYGVLTWGLGVGTIFYLIQIALGFRFEWFFFILNEAVFIVAGFLWGLWNWSYVREKIEKR
jgi:hypothetical protein